MKQSAVGTRQDGSVVREEPPLFLGWNSPCCGIRYLVLRILLPGIVDDLSSLSIHPLCHKHLLRMWCPAPEREYRDDEVMVPPRALRRAGRWESLSLMTLDVQDKEQMAGAQWANGFPDRVHVRLRPKGTRGKEAKGVNGSGNPVEQRGQRGVCEGTGS